MSTEISRLLWRCRRGARELDSLLVPYGTARIPELEPVELANFSMLLKQQDPDLLSWFLGRTEPDQPAIAAAIHDVLMFREKEKSCQQKNYD